MFGWIQRSSEITYVAVESFHNREVRVVGVPRHMLPAEGFTVHYTPTQRMEENPTIQRLGNALQITGPAQRPANIVENHGGRSIHIGDVHSSFGNIHIGSGSNVYVNGRRIMAGDLRHAPSEELSPITIRVPQALEQARLSGCKALNVENLPKVDVDLSGNANLTGRAIGALSVKASGASHVTIRNIGILEVYLSGSSKVIARSIQRSSHIRASGASDVTLDHANGPLSAAAHGDSAVKAKGSFSRINAQASGRSTIRVVGSCATQPHTSTQGASSVSVSNF